MTEQGLSGSLPESEGAVEKSTEVAAPVDTGPAGNGVPEMPPPWTHHIGGSKVRFIAEEGDEIVFEVLVPDADEITAAVERRTVTKAEWAERAVSFTVEQAAEQADTGRPPEVRAGRLDTEGAATAPGGVGGREATLTELAAVAGVTIERNPDGSSTLRGADLPKGGLVVEPDKMREVLAGVGDGTWREA